MGAQVLGDDPSGRAGVLLEKPLLDGDQQGVGQHADEDGLCLGYSNRWNIGCSISELFIARNAASTRVRGMEVCRGSSAIRSCRSVCSL